MRKLLLIAMTAITAIMLLVAAPAWAFTGGAMVSGSGALGMFGNPIVRMSATQTRGEFTLLYEDGTLVSGDATCLSVSGSTAYLTAQIKMARGPRVPAENWTAGNFIIIGVQGNHSTGPDLLNFSSGFASNPGCGPNGAAAPVFPVVRGHFRVSGS